MKYSLSEIDKAAAFVISQARYKVIAFTGEMGAGKTTLIKAICHQLGVEAEPSSPTFSIVNEYAARDNNLIYHFDFYRIDDLNEVYDMGYEEYLHSGKWCLIEWPEKIEPLLNYLPHDKVTINLAGDEMRELMITST
jgi:tRNA threonylcarbamoyladenosine biosynthesis protein TsaE